MCAEGIDKVSACSAGLMPGDCKGAQDYSILDNLALLDFDGVPRLCRNRSPTHPVADGVHHYLNDGCKLSLDDTLGNRLAVGERDKSDVASPRAVRLVVDGLQGIRNVPSGFAKTNKSLNLLRGVADYALADLQPAARRICLLLCMQREA
jgi:hypothetical protein